MNNHVSILIVTHNHRGDLPKLINSLTSYGYPNVYFCDANSSDGTKEYLLSSPFKENVLVKDKLESFSKNNNDLLRHFEISSKYVLILNPDTYFEEDIIEGFLEEVTIYPSAGIITPLVKYPSGEIQKSWKKFPDPFQVIAKRLGLRTIEDEPVLQPGRIDWCLGAAMFVEIEKLLESGNNLFDERYRLYCEDADLCVKCQDRGFDVIATDKVVLFHKLGEQGSKKLFSKYVYWNLSSAVKFIIKWNWKYLKLMTKK